MRDPETLLEVMDRDAEGGFLTPGVVDRHQVEATLILAEQVKRIADILDTYHLDVTDQATGDTYRVLGVGNVIRRGSYSFE